MFRQLCGDEAMKNVILVTNMWGEVSPEVGEKREAELAADDIFFKPALDKEAKIRRHDNTYATAHKIVQDITANVPIRLKIQHELIEERKRMSDTAAGQYLNREQAEEMSKLQLEVEELQKELEDAIGMEDDEVLAELEAAKEKLQIKVGRMQSDSDKLVAIRSEQVIRPTDNGQRSAGMETICPPSTNQTTAPATLGQWLEWARNFLLKGARKLIGIGEDDTA